MEISEAGNKKIRKPNQHLKIQSLSVRKLQDWQTGDKCLTCGIQIHTQELDFLPCRRKHVNKENQDGQAIETFIFEAIVILQNCIVHCQQPISPFR
jgi:hypothetical protein